MVEQGQRIITHVKCKKTLNAMRHREKGKVGIDSKCTSDLLIKIDLQEGMPVPKLQIHFDTICPSI